MYDDPAAWLEALRYSSGDTLEVLDDFRNWGFTIYRTAYGPLTNERWEHLLKTIRATVKYTPTY